MLDILTPKTTDLIQETFMRARLFVGGCPPDMKQVWEMIPQAHRASLSERYHDNQITAALELVRNFQFQNVRAQLLSALMQSGKTGAVLCFCEIMVTAFKFQGQFLFIVPADKQLQLQTDFRVLEARGVAVRLVGGKVWNASEIYKKGKQYDKLRAHCQDALDTFDDGIIVISDECHTGIGGKKSKAKDIQKIPAFYRDILGFLPGVTEHPKVKFLGVSATGFAYEVLMGSPPQGAPGFEEVMLQPGKGYLGKGDFFQMGRFRQAFPVIPFRKRPTKCLWMKSREWKRYQLERFKVYMAAKLRAFKKHYANNPRVFVARMTNKDYREAFKEAAIAAGFGLGDYKEIRSDAANVAEFAELLESQPSQPMVCVLIHTYAQGKTLTTKYIGAWYEGDTQAGRHDASVAQSIGRCCGYDKGNDKFKIYAQFSQLADWIVYENCHLANDATGKRAQAMTATHLKRTEKLRMQCSLISEPTAAAAKQAYEQRYPHASNIKYTVQTSSRNNSFDALKETAAANDSERQKREAVKIRYCDGPSNYPTSQASWNNNPQLHGRYVILIPNGKLVVDKTISSNNTYLNKN